MTSARAAILLVEDDQPLADGMAENLRAEGYDLDVAHDGRNGLRLASDDKYDLLILDVMLPDVDGIDLCRELRRQERHTPVLFLTAKGDPEDRVRGLSAGGDDYLTKPFHLDEFLLRIRAILKRWDWYKQGSTRAGSPTLNFGGNRIDFGSFRAQAWDGSSYNLTEKEGMILKVLAERPNEVIGRDDLLETVWGYDVYPSTRTIDNFILRLRKMFEREPNTPRHFVTIRGVGYRFSPSGDS